MTIPSSVSLGLATDTRTVGSLRATATKDPASAIKETAKQFEALFMQELLKSMRQATPTTGMLDNSGTELGTQMLDSQLATKMTGIHGGLGELIAKQLQRQMGTTAASKDGADAAATPVPGLSAPTTNRTLHAPPSPIKTPMGTPIPASSLHSDASLPTQRQADFLHQHSQDAFAAEAQSGIPAAYMLGQAAHESGWGQREILNADGSSSHNLFGVKAGRGWSGPVAEITTTEVTDGQAHKVTAKFRAYASYADAFRDYAQMMKDSPRYASVAAQAASAASSAQGYAQGLQRAGYATDPAYADKLARAINTTMRLQRAVS